ncbi:MAG: hypothetical protein AAF335_01345 [Bacteroidota bacterium]
MMTYKEHSKVLERKLKEEKKLDKIMDYFLTHFGEQSQFIEDSKPLKDYPLLRNLAKAHLKRLGEKTSSLSLFVSRFKESGLVHGCFVAEKCSGMLFYFEKSHVGLMSQQSLTTNGMMHYYRFFVEDNS